MNASNTTKVIALLTIAFALYIYATTPAGQGGMRREASKQDSPVAFMPAPLVPSAPAPHPQAQAKNNDKWIQVPDWLAGRWHATSELVLFSYDYKLKKELIQKPLAISISRFDTIGSQQDRSGRIWHFTGTPYQQSVETDTYVEIQNVQKMQLVESKPNTLVIRSVGLIYEMDKATGQMQDSFIEETYARYTYLHDNLIQNTMQINDFDTQGNALRSSKKICIEERIEPFFPTNIDERGNLNQMFNQFLAP